MWHQMFHIPILMAGNIPKKVLKEDALTTLDSFNYITIYEIFVFQRKLVVKYNFIIKLYFTLIYLLS